MSSLMGNQHAAPIAAFLIVAGLVWGGACAFRRGRSRRGRPRIDLRELAANTYAEIFRIRTMGQRSHLELSPETTSRSNRPARRTGEDALRLRLAGAGLSEPNAVADFCAVRGLTATLASFLTGGASAAFSIAWWSVPLAMIVGAGAGFVAPGALVMRRARTRRARMARRLPDAIDLLTIGLEAGLGFDAALLHVGRSMRRSAPELFEEFDLCGAQLRGGTPRHAALQELGARTGMHELNSLAATLIQSERMGTSIVESLCDLVRSARAARRNAILEMAHGASTRMALLLVTLILPALFAVLLGPAAISIATTFSMN